uniref:Uncharacterized protein n=1 Tax=Panagrolaimus sp. JU765 TaxID=591449 RepID=A0AC34Q761_9BILA
MSLTLQTSPVLTSAKKHPPNWEKITWAPKKENKFKPRIFLSHSFDLPSETSRASRVSSSPQRSPSPEKNTTPKMPPSEVKPFRLEF